MALYVDLQQRSKEICLSEVKVVFSKENEIFGKVDSSDLSPSCMAVFKYTHKIKNKNYFLLISTSSTFPNLPW